MMLNNNLREKTLTNNDRLDYIDIARAFGIIFVIIDHTYFAMSHTDSFHLFILTFHMPLFFCIAGLTLKNESIFLFFKKRIYRILMPYFLWCLILGSGITVPNLRLSINPSCAILWFLPCYFCVNILTELIIKISNIFTISIIKFLVQISLTILFCLCGLYLSMSFPNFSIPFSFDIALAVVPFTIFASILRLYIIPIFENNYLKNIHRWILFVCLCFFCYMIFFSQKNGIIVTAFHNYGNKYHVFLINGIIGSSIIIYISLFISKKTSSVFTNFFIIIGRNTFFIYAIHQVILNNFFTPLLQYKKLCLLIALLDLICIMILVKILQIFFPKLYDVLSGNFENNINNTWKEEIA